MSLVNLRDDASMRFAFSVTTKQSKESRMDPRYVKMITRVYRLDRDKDDRKTKSEQIIGHHICTDDDWAQFAPPSEIAVPLFERI